MTDRTNIVELSALGKNVPVRHGYDREAEGYEYEWGESRYYSMFNNDEARVKRFMYLDQETNATTGKATGACDDDEQNEQALTNCKHLNAASGYFDGGLVQMGHIWYHPFGRTFHYMSTRNNDFTNRSQKATIVLKAWKLTLVLGSVGLLFALCCVSFLTDSALSWCNSTVPTRLCAEGDVTGAALAEAAGGDSGGTEVSWCCGGW